MPRLEDPGPFRVNIYDKAFAFKFPLVCMTSVTPRHLAQPSGALTVPLKHRRTEALFEKGMRATVDYLIGADRNDEASWLPITSGKLTPLQIPEGAAPTVGKSVTFTIEDDWRILRHLKGWPVPGSAIGSQGAAAYDVRSGPAETVVKGYVTANKGRLPYSVTVATDLARGSTVYGSVRFNGLDEALVPLAAQGGIGMRVRQSGSGLLFDVYVPTDRSARILSEAASTITAWSLTSSGPQATAAIIATDGEGTARHFTRIQDTTVRDDFGDYIEAFVDARDLVNTQASEIAQRAAQALADGAPQAGWSVTMAETDVVKYGRNLLVGDRVRVEILPNLAITDVLSECTITWGTNGLTVAPKVGSSTGQLSPNRLLNKAAASALRGIQTLRSSL